MKIRVMQIWGFLMAVLGWIFVACSMAMEGWKIASIGGMGGSSIIKVAWYWSSLWRSCFTDSTSVSNCYDFPVLWSVEDHVQVVRGLLMAALVVGMLGFVVSLIGMECTFIGGKDKSKHKKIFFGGFCHITSGILSTFGYAVYAIYVSGEYYNPGLDGLQYDLGTPLFLGWVGSAFQCTGGAFYLVSVCKVLCDDEPVRVPPALPEEAKSLSSVSVITSKTKVSTVSELSSKSALSDVSAISSASARPSPGRSSRSGRSERSSGSSRTPGSRGSERSRSRSSSRSVSSLSDASRRSEKGQFIKNSYI
ncbi:claudin-10 [Osmerus mordax]|uniref:claudin-10 n=1 Tax=Osmerus mordax TaxID=8014 RepID=UPI00350F941A